MDAASKTEDELSWTDLIAFAARVATKTAFTDALKAQINKTVLPPGLGNDFPMPKLGGVDASAPAPAGSLPGPGADAAAWLALFAKLGLRPADLASLGPDVCGPDEAANVAMLSKARDMRARVCGRTFCAPRL